jgi:hypothetical protein
MAANSAMRIDPDEQEPLLPSQLQDVRQDEEHSQVLTEEAVRTKTIFWKIVWYTFLSLVTVFFLALFIKGFIDADDVDVSSLVTLVIVRSWYRLTLSSLIWGRLSNLRLVVD